MGREPNKIQELRDELQELTAGTNEPDTQRSMDLTNKPSDKKILGRNLSVKYRLISISRP